jgi:hypothetical protein
MSQNPTTSKNTRRLTKTVVLFTKAPKITASQNQLTEAVILFSEVGTLQGPPLKKAEAQQAEARPDSRLQYIYMKLGFGVTIFLPISPPPRPKGATSLSLPQPTTPLLSHSRMLLPSYSHIRAVHAMAGASSSSFAACGFSIHAVLHAASLVCTTCVFGYGEASGAAHMATMAQIQWWI